MTEVLVPVSAGELIDKITILRLKSERIGDASRLVNVRRELQALERVAAESLPDANGLDGLTGELQAVNTRLWEIEDSIRDCEAAGDFGPQFVELARAVYITNDRRSEIKRRINMLLGSAIVEEKSYADYGAGGDT